MSATQDFYNSDFSSTLFPLKTNHIFVNSHETEASEYIYQKILRKDFPDDCFLPQQRVYAAKPKGHLRRTTKLDPIAEYFIYDLIYRNRTIFRPPVGEFRCCYGYRFKDGGPIPINASYRAFRAGLEDFKNKYKCSMSFDIGSYFNSIYHHDLSSWFSAQKGVSAEDINAFGQYFREINAGKSVDFLPHGIYPCKMIGNEFLKFIDLNGQIKSSVLLRFMDDFYLFDDSEDVIFQDFIKIQQLLGIKGLNVNSAKTNFGHDDKNVSVVISEIKESLEDIQVDIEYISTASGVEPVEIEVEIERTLDDDHVKTLLTFFRHESLEESEADLILTFLKSHSDSVLEYFPTLLSRFPSISKHICSVSAGIADKNELANIILSFIKQSSNLLEYQLFWLGVLAEEHLSTTAVYGDILNRLFEITADHRIARAKILEIPEQNFGLKEIRGEYLKTGQSDWLSWASAMGSRSVNLIERNYMLDYFSKCSPVNSLISDCVKKL